MSPKISTVVHDNEWRMSFSDLVHVHVLYCCLVLFQCQFMLYVYEAKYGIIWRTTVTTHTMYTVLVHCMSPSLSDTK